jgi:Glycosyltransferases involved in cell wall biogenesis
MTSPANASSKAAALSMPKKPRLSVVFATRNRRQMVQETIEAVRRECAGMPYEIVIVDGLSTDGTSEYLAAQPDVAHIREERLEGCCRAFDKGFRAARAELVFWINDDVALSPGCLARAVAFMDAPENADVGIGALPLSTSAERLDVFVFNCCGYPPVPYADMGVIRRGTLKDVGYLTLDFKRFGWDPDLSLKVWALGQRVAVVSGAEITHSFSTTTCASRTNICGTRTPACWNAAGTGARRDWPKWPGRPKPCARPRPTCTPSTRRSC